MLTNYNSKLFKSDGGSDYLISFGFKKQTTKSLQINNCKYLYSKY